MPTVSNACRSGSKHQQDVLTADWKCPISLAMECNIQWSRNNSNTSQRQPKYLIGCATVAAIQNKGIPFSFAMDARLSHAIYSAIRCLVGWNPKASGCVTTAGENVILIHD